jgi:CRP-like cAMP-binding protein
MLNGHFGSLRPEMVIDCCQSLTNPKKISTLCRSLTKKAKEGATSLYFEQGQFLFYEGHAPYGLYLLLSGKIELTFSSKPSMQIDSAPTILGLFHIFQNQSYCCSCQAISPVHVVFIAKSQLKDICSVMAGHPRVCV